MRLARLVFGSGCVLLLVAVCYGENTIPLVDRFMNSLPYQVAYTRFGSSTLPSFMTGSEFLPVKCVRCVDSHRGENCFKLMTTSLLYQQEYYPYFFPSTIDGCTKYTTTRGDTLAFRITAKPPVPSDSIARKMEFVVQAYSLHVRDYEFAKSEYEGEKNEAYATLVLYPWLVAASVVLMSSKQQDTRTAGYITGSLVAIGLVVDTKGIIEWLGMKKKAREKRLVLENWSGTDISRILDSLNIAH